MKSIGLNGHDRHRRTSTIIFTGLLINYPLNIFCLWLLLTQLELTDPLVIGTISSMIFTVAGYCRVYTVLYMGDRVGDKIGDKV